MSAQEIIAELGKLKPEELRLVRARLDALAAAASRVKGGSSETGKAAAQDSNNPLSDFLLRVAGTAEGLPPDMAQNHDHYLYGTPKAAPQ